MAVFVIATSRAVRRASAHGGGEVELEFTPDPRLGVYPTRRAAKAAYMRMMDPAFGGASEGHCALAFDHEQRNLRHACVVRMEE